jgi:peptidyl-prolyl cis-trans isomerase D
MAVIQKIRDKYAKLAGGLIAFALIGFILMDAMTGTTGRNIMGFFKGGNYAFKVNGNAVDPMQFQTRVSEYEALYQIYGNMHNIDEATRAQIHERVLSEMIYESALEKQMESLGIRASKDEVNDIIYGSNPDQLVQQFPYFKDQKTGQFNPQYVRAFEQQLKSRGGQQEKTLLELWEKVKAYVIRNHKVQKYTALLVNGIYTPEYVIDMQAKEQQQSAVIRFVKVPFNTINDNEVQVTDADLEAYIKAHAPQFTNYNPNRSIAYVSFDVVPSADDTAKVMAAILQAKTDLEKSTDPASTVGANSEDPYNDAYVTKTMFGSRYGDTLFSLPVGSVYGPYEENNAYKVVKVVDRKILPDSVKVRHILVRTKNQGQEALSDTLAKAKIDSIVHAIQTSGADFTAMVAQFSDDESSKQTGGEYEFTLAQRAQLSKEFGDFIFEGKAGEKKVVQVENPNYAGYHYIEIINQSGASPAEKLAVITKSINFSEETYQTEFAKAAEFAGKATTAQAFDENIKSQNLYQRVAASIKLGDFSVQGITGSREIIKWVFDAKKQAIYPPSSI